MKAIVIALAFVLAGCSQVIGGPDRSAGHGGNVHVSTQKPDQTGKPGSEDPKDFGIKSE